MLDLYVCIKEVPTFSFDIFNSSTAYSVGALALFTEPPPLENWRRVKLLIGTDSVVYKTEEYTDGK